jgi:hypothetical protein
MISEGIFDMRINENTTEEICDFLKLLVNDDEVPSLTLCGLIMDSKQEIQCITDTMFSVAKGCPNLQKLVFKKGSSTEYEWEYCDIVTMLSCTLRFVGLQELHMEKLVCTDLGLALLAQNLPRLRYNSLKVSI